MKRFINIGKKRGMGKSISQKSEKSEIPLRGLLLIFALILLFGNIASFLVEYRIRKDIFTLFMQDLSSFRFQAIAFIVQWGIIFGVFIVAKMYHRQLPAPVVQKAPVEETKALKKAFTDIDVLYATLQKKGNLKMSVIAETFKIDKEKALEWSKILESHELAEIRYRVFAEPELVVREEA